MTTASAYSEYTREELRVFTFLQDYIDTDVEYLQDPIGFLMNNYLTIDSERKQYRSVLKQIKDELEGYVDITDGANGQPQPNFAMRICSMIDETL